MGKIFTHKSPSQPLYKFQKFIFKLFIKPSRFKHFDIRDKLINKRLDLHNVRNFKLQNHTFITCGYKIAPFKSLRLKYLAIFLSTKSWTKKGSLRLNHAEFAFSSLFSSLSSRHKSCPFLYAPRLCKVLKSLAIVFLLTSFI